MAKRTYKRRKKLIKPRFQLKVALAGLGISVVAVLLLMIMVNEALMEFASKGWVDAAALEGEWMSILLRKLLIALVFLVPLTLAMGILMTHKIAGPIYRFEMFLNAVMAGQHPEPCRLRDGDEFKDFCELLNKVTAPLRDGSLPTTTIAAEDLAVVEAGVSAVEAAGEDAEVTETAAA